jgi:mitochondrial fission protein ELM1
MNPPLSILMLGDGKPGHENQSLGLIEAIGRRVPIEVERLAPRRRGLAAVFAPDLPQRRPRLIIGAGHRVHLPMLALARRTGAPCVVLMKPSLPGALFDTCIIPEHDLGNRAPGPHVIASKGALNRVPPTDGIDKFGGLILLGGPSAAHGWDEEAVTSSVREIVAQGGDRPWRITDSRRTPEGALGRLTDACPALAAYPHRKTGAEWLPLRLAEAAEVWVTEDSVSMIYESLSSGARVGLLPAPVRKHGRVTRGIERLVADGWLTRFRDWDRSRALPAPPRVLREADRCAVRVLERHCAEYA